MVYSVITLAGQARTHSSFAFRGFANSRSRPKRDFKKMPEISRNYIKNV